MLPTDGKDANPAAKGSERGQAMLIALLIVAVAVITLPVVVFTVQGESRWTIKQSRSSRAYHLAEGGQDRASYFLQTPSNWASASAGTAIAGYSGDVAYSDLSGGLYRIFLSSGPQPGQVTIITQGRDDSAKEVRSIQAVVALPSSESAIYTNGISFSGGSGAQWGPISSNAGIAVSGASDVCYPMKYAAGTISGMAAACHANAPGFAYTGAATPCTDGAEWSVLACPPSFPPPPAINLDSYRSLAKASSCPTAVFPGGASPAGSCYWPTGQNPQFSGVNMAWTPQTIFVEGNLTSSSGCLYGNVLAVGSLTFSGGGTCPTYTINNIPPTAWRQYSKLDTSAPGEYYGDAGYHQVNPTFTFNMAGGKSPSQCAAGSNCQSGTSMQVAARGFVYVGTSITASGGSVIHGVLFSPNYLSGFSGSSTVFFDQAVADQLIRQPQGLLKRLSWREIVQPWTP